MPTKKNLTLTRERAMETEAIQMQAGVFVIFSSRHTESESIKEHGKCYQGTVHTEICKRPRKYEKVTGC